MNFNIIIKKNIWQLVIALFLIITGDLYDRYYWQKGGQIKAAASKIQSGVRERLKALDKLENDESFLSLYIENPFNQELKQKIKNTGWDVYLFRNDSLVSWTNNILDPKICLNISGTKTGIIEGKNGYFIGKSKFFNQYKLIFSYPIYITYEINNKYLSPHFNDQFKVDNKATFSAKSFEGSQAIRDLSTYPLYYFKLVPLESFYKSWISLIWIGAGFLLLGLFIFRTFDNLSENREFLKSLGFLVIIFTGFRILMSVFKYPRILYESKLFDPEYFSYSNFLPSLGDFLINSLLWFFVLFTAFKYVNLHFKNPLTIKNKFFKILLFISAFFSLLIITDFKLLLIQQLIRNSNIALDVTNLLASDLFSVLGLIITGLLLFSHYLLINIFVLLFSEITEIKWKPVLYGILAIIIFLLLQYSISGEFSSGFQSVFYLVAIVITTFLISDLSLFQKTVSLVFIISVFASSLFYRFNKEKELDIRKEYANAINNQKDLNAENIFVQVEHQIESDQFVVDYFRNPLILKSQLEKRIKQLYFSGYLGRYEVLVFDYDSIGNPVKEMHPYNFEYINNLYNTQVEPTLSAHFYYINSPSERFKYIARFDFCSTDQNYGSLFILLRTRTIQDNNLFAKLLTESSNEEFKPNDNYSYAIYQDGVLLNQSGDFAYPVNYSFGDFEGLETEIDRDGFSHLITREEGRILSIVSKEEDSYLKPLSVFSFLFVAYSFLTFVVLLYNGLSNLIRLGIAFATQNRRKIIRFYSFFRKVLPKTRFKGFLFSSRIQLAMTSLVFFVLIATAYVTTGYISYRYREDQRQQLVDKAKSVLNAIEKEGRFEDKLFYPDEVTAYLNQLGDFYGTDIHFFADNGKILSSTKMRLFMSGISGEWMNSDAYSQLKLKRKSLFIQDEIIGKLNYVSIYIPLYLPETNKIIGFLNLPYFGNEEDLNKDISSFLANFINLYLLFFIVAGAVAFTISQRITSPLVEIQSKMASTNLLKNEKIDYKGNDEIGQLVKQYNKMIEELGNSAERLAESEREGAWKEMAKQIAHEIKNPLTPMKLSIQHLQRSWVNKNENIDEVFKKVTAILIEQIDSLSALATEFSSFAKMPISKPEVLKVSEVLDTVISLHSQSENIKFERDFQNPEAQVFMDKDQLLRIFTNIIKNAIQAIPEDRAGIINARIISRNNRAIIEIRDNGKGISEDIAPKIFSPYFSTKSSGMGIGLSMCKKMAEASNGSISFESKIDEFTVFRVDLPLLIKGTNQIGQGVNLDQ